MPTKLGPRCHILSIYYFIIMPVFQILMKILLFFADTLMLIIENLKICHNYGIELLLKLNLYAAIYTCEKYEDFYNYINTEVNVFILITYNN